MEEIANLLLPMVITSVLLIALDGLFSAFDWLIQMIKDAFDF